MTLLASLPRTSWLTNAARLDGYRTRDVQGWLHIYDSPPMTPGVRRKPRERCPEVGDYIAQPWAEALNQAAIEAQRESSRMGACKVNRMRAEARRLAAQQAER